MYILGFVWSNIWNFENYALLSLFMCFMITAITFKLLLLLLVHDFPNINVICSICILPTIGKYVANTYHKSLVRNFVIWDHSEVNELKGYKHYEECQNLENGYVIILHQLTSLSPWYLSCRT
uniref:Uncharacterized protein n=1 Tax=Arundo donax TaxID=35708 RepID=A0A0A9B942_ARUDO